MKTFEEATKILSECHQRELRNVSSGDSEFEWRTINDKKLIAHGYRGNSNSYVSFIGVFGTVNCTEEELKLLFQTRKTYSGHLNESELPKGL